MTRPRDPSPLPPDWMVAYMFQDAGFFLWTAVAHNITTGQNVGAKEQDDLPILWAELNRMIAAGEFLPRADEGQEHAAG